jgi:hypothetical protein
MKDLLKAAEAAYEAYSQHMMWHERGCTYMDAPMEELRRAINAASIERQQRPKNFEEQVNNQMARLLMDYANGS